MPGTTPTLAAFLFCISGFFVVGFLGLDRRYALGLLVIMATVLACLAGRLVWTAWPHERRRIRRAKGLCVACGYDLTGNASGACPECGEATA